MTSGHNAGKWVFNNLFTGKFVMADTEEEINRLFEEYLSKTRDNKISYA
jgi:hypothetical protein